MFVCCVFLLSLFGVWGGGGGSDVVKYFVGLAGLGVEKQQLIKIVDSDQLRYTVTRFFDTDQAVKLMRILALIDYWEPEIWSCLFEKTWWINPQKTKTETLVRLFFVKQIAELFQQVKVPNFPQDTFHAMQQSWEQCRTPTRSIWQNTVFNTLHQIGYENMEEEVNILDGIYSIDIVLNIQNQKIALELDGMYHFSGNCPHVVLGCTKCRNRVIKKLGFKLVTISMYDWQVLEKGQFIKNDLLIDKIETALN
eukprot:TRINITY_DN11800_c0_g1_i1.p2 TRINITY_DN11800_c0_g1~~TRINITY_DN11800_c0_g1_i1.p2  ORF type:complete len:262 (-),score=30.64 TRINITY_DN11800_c0_g1_i1:310-1065(-)